MVKNLNLKNKKGQAGMLVAGIVVGAIVGVVAYDAYQGNDVVRDVQSLTSTPSGDLIIDSITTSELEYIITTEDSDVAKGFQDITIEVDKDSLVNGLDVFQLSVLKYYPDGTKLSDLDVTQTLENGFIKDYQLEDSNGEMQRIYSDATTKIGGSSTKQLSMVGSTAQTIDWTLSSNPNSVVMTTIKDLENIDDEVEIPLIFGQKNKVTLVIVN